MAEPFNIVIVEDVPDDAELMVLQLRNAGLAFRWKRVDDEENYRKALAEGPDLILSDWSLPGFGGLSALRLMVEAALDIPFIIVSGEIGEEMAVEALRMGACDYVLKDRLARLGAAVARAMGEKRLRRHRRDAEEALRESDARWQFALEGAGDGLWDWNAETNEVYFSRQWKTMLGYEEEEIGSTLNEWDRLVHPDDRTHVYRDLERHLADKTPSYSSEHRLLCKDGTYKWVLDRGKVVKRGLDGRPIRVIGTHADISDRKRAEDELKASEEKYRLLFEQSPLGIFHFDVHGVIQECNDNFVQIIGSSRDALVGFNMLAQLSDKELEAEVRKAISGIPGYYENYYRSMTAQKVTPVRVLLRGIVENGVFVMGVGIVEDISERKKAEDATQKSIRRLRRVTGSIINVIVMAVETRDPYTAGHQRRVADLARTIAGEMGLPSEQMEGIRVAGIIHDLGKISIPAEILSMPRRLTPVEYDLVKAHSRIGHDILKDIDFDWPVAEIIFQHHERINGSGYPRCLKGEEILPEARIIAVADVVEAVASHRPYRPALGIESALAEIEKNKGVLYDPDAVEACVRLFREKTYSLVTS